MVQGKSGMIYMNDVNPVGALDGGTAGGRVRYPAVRIGGGVCPRCGGCDFYCADCTFPLLAALEAVADVAQEIMEKATW